MESPWGAECFGQKRDGWVDRYKKSFCKYLNKIIYILELSLWSVHVCNFIEMDVANKKDKYDIYH